ncbi:MAG: 2-phosphosulfolactate phosphatase [Nocardioides sp.]
MTDPRPDSRTAAHAQAGHRVRLEWGPTGGAAVAAGADVAVVVDVLSFTTTLTVAVERGITVYPYRWKDERAAEYAASLGAVLAVGRFEQRDSGGRAVSLSPAAMAGVEGVDRIVLPSPNGSTICAALAGSGAQVVGACLRNRAAVAAWLAPQVAAGATVAVVPAGERWPDGSLRPAAEDLWGAGAVLAALGGDLSPEAALARDAFRAVEGGLAGALPGCAGGQELTVVGFADDVQMAGELDVSEVVPVLGPDGAFRPAA